MALGVFASVDGGWHLSRADEWGTVMREGKPGD